MSTYTHSNLSFTMLCGSALLVALVNPSSALAGGITAGTLIENTAVASYDDGGGPRTINSNTVTVRVDELLDVTLTSLDPGPLAAQPGDQVLTFELTHQGNGPEAFRLTALAAVAGNDFDVTINSVAIDSNGNGIYDDGVDEVLPSPQTTAVLAPDSVLTVFVLVTVPDGVGDTESSAVDLTAEAVTGSGAPGTVFAGQGVDGGDAIVGTTGALATARGELNAGIATVELVKSVTLADPFGGTSAVPGTIATFTIAARVAAGSVSTLAQYNSTLTCVNTSGATRAALPNNLLTTDFNLGELEFGEALVCTFTNAAQPRLRLRKALGTQRRFNTDQFTVRIRQGETVVATSTSTGTGNNIASGDTGLVQVISGQAYSLDEIAAGTGHLGNYTATMACTNTASGSSTTLPTSVGGVVTPQLGDTITCIITNRRQSTAVLVIEKTSVVVSDPVNGTVNPKAVPGAIIEYAITIRNVGTRVADFNSIVIIDLMPSNMAFAVTTPITFTNGTTSSGLNTFNPATMVSYSTQANGLSPFTYTPTGTYDQAVRGIRIAPTGTMNSASSATNQPSFTIRFRARVE